MFALARVRRLSCKIDSHEAHLLTHGPDPTGPVVLLTKALGEDPTTGIAPQGPDALFPGEQADKLIEALHVVRDNAVA